MARKETTTESTPGRLAQIAQTYRMTREVDARIGLVLAGVLIVTFGVILGIGFAIGHPVWAGILGILLGLLATAVVFGRRAERAAFGQMEGKPGAALAVLQNVGRGWTVSQAVAANRQQDMVHRAVGRAGVVLIGEGNPNRVKGLLANEKKKVARVVYDVPVHDYIVGDDEGQLPLRKIRSTMLRLPRTLSGPKATEVSDRLRALGDLMSNMPIPKGPLPKGMRMPRGPR
jgi:hypothetical protein